MRVLVAEDDRGLRSVLERGLKEDGYVVDAVPDGAAALRYLAAYEYEAVVLDWRMPTRSGIEVLDEMRRRGNCTPVLMLTARDATADRVIGLNSGADDYLVKPFAFEELAARLHALQRRPALAHKPLLACGHLTYQPDTHEARSNGKAVALTAIERSLLELLLRRSPTVVTRRSIAVQVWDDEADAISSNTIDVHMGRLRSKLGDCRAHIETVRGAGYRLVAT